MDVWKSRRKPSLTIEYRRLGTISLAQLAQAIWEDIQALRDTHGVSYVTAVRLTIPVTDEFGEPLLLRQTDGQALRRLDTTHYRPACLDYKL